MTTETISQEMHSLDSEVAVLGSLLASNGDAYDQVGDILIADDFVKKGHRHLFNAISSLAKDGHPVDVVTVTDRLQTMGIGSVDKTKPYVSELLCKAPIGGIVRHAQIIVEKRMARQLLAAAGQMEELAHSPGDIHNRMNEAQGLVMSLAESGTSDEAQGITGILSDLVEWMQERNESDEELSGLATGFLDLDRATSGFQDGNLIIVAGRPAMGKTAFSMNIAENVAMEGKSVLVYSMEMSKLQLSQRLVASLGSLSLDRVLNPKLLRDGDDDWSKLSTALGKLHSQSMYIDDSVGMSIAKMHAKARRHKRKYGLHLVVVDYIQLMGGGDGKNRNRVEEISEITRGLKLMAKDLGVPVIALSQLSRKVEERQDKRPLLSDLRESGSIEQDADVIIFMYRDDYYNAESQYKGMAEAIIAKQRMGATKSIPLTFQGEFSRFKSFSGTLPDPVEQETSAKSSGRGFSMKSGRA